MTFDFKKEYKEFYMPKNKPQIVNVPKANYIAVRGKGNPNEEDGAYQTAISILYAVAYTLKMSYKTDYKIEGFFEYVVPPLEGFWWQDDVDKVDYRNKGSFNWISVIRLPDFVTEKDFAWAVETATRKKRIDCTVAEFLTIDEGLCVQIMHNGPFDNEPATVAIMDEFIEQNGYVNDMNKDRLHHEIYMSDARKVAPEKWKTVIRHPIRKKDDSITLTKEELAIVKNQYGMEIVLNHLTPTELVDKGYTKLAPDELVYIEPFVKLAPQLVVDKIKNDATRKAFDKAVQDSYKCILDPSKHLATIKGTTDVYIGAALNNENNQLSGQARWLKNDVKLSIAKFPDYALRTFNALSIVTGQYFMSQVNAKLVDISTGIKDIQEYLEAKEQSELETAFQELNEIIAHLKYSIKDADRTRSVVNQLDEIKRISSNSIILHKRSVEKIKREATFSDNAKVIENNLKDIRNHLIRYQFAAYIYNLADMLKIYMNNVIDIQELKLYRDELAHMVNEYQMIFEETMQWIETYLDETKTLNDASWAQVVTSFGVGIFTGILGSQVKNYKAGAQSALMVNRAFEKNRQKKKNSIVESQKNYKEHVKNVSMLEESVEAIDSYIIAVQSKTEIVLCEGDYYIKYIGEDEE